MGKRSAFIRIERDFYPTPYEAVIPLLSQLPPNVSFVEPCAGNGALLDHLVQKGLTCVEAWDIEPKRQGILFQDATKPSVNPNADFFITNPPWTRSILHQLIPALSTIRPTWLLFDADWAHTRQAIPFLPRLRCIVSVGRLKWIPDSAFSGKDNCAWHLFTEPSNAPIEFVGRRDIPTSALGIANISLDDI